MDNSGDPKEVSKKKVLKKEDEKAVAKTLSEIINAIVENAIREKFQFFKKEIEFVIQKAISEIKEETEQLKNLHSIKKKRKYRRSIEFSTDKWVNMQVNLSLVDIKLLSPSLKENEERTWVLSFSHNKKAKEFTVTTIHPLDRAKYISFVIPFGVKNSQYLFINDKENRISIS